MSSGDTFTHYGFNWWYPAIGFVAALLIGAIINRLLDWHSPYVLFAITSGAVPTLFWLRAITIRADYIEIRGLLGGVSHIPLNAITEMDEHFSNNTYLLLRTKSGTRIKIPYWGVARSKELLKQLHAIIPTR